MAKMETRRISAQLVSSVAYVVLRFRPFAIRPPLMLEIYGTHKSKKSQRRHHGEVAQGISSGRISRIIRRSSSSTHAKSKTSNAQFCNAAVLNVIASRAARH